MANSGFSTAQLLAWADLNAETLRYWKKILPPIAGRDGRSSRYTWEEIVALAVIGRATGLLQVPIATFAPHADALFETVAAHMRDGGTPSLAFIHGDDVSFGGPETLPDAEALAIVRIDRVLKDVQNRMIRPKAPPPQMSLFQFDR